MKLSRGNTWTLCVDLLVSANLSMSSAAVTEEGRSAILGAVAFGKAVLPVASLAGAYRY
jgi:hypothetical protein